MAASSLYENVKINTRKEANDFLTALDESRRLQDSIPKKYVSFKIADKEDISKLSDMWRKGRISLS